MENFFTVNQVAFILKVHKLTVRRYLREKKLVGIKIGGAVRIREADLQKFQKEYIARETKNLDPTVRSEDKAFTENDPFWRLNGAGMSLSLPE